MAASASGLAQLFGVDRTPPQQDFASGPADGSVNAGNTWVVSFIDGLHPDSGAIVGCFSFMSDDGMITIPAIIGVYRVTVYVARAAGNPSATMSRITTISS